VRYDEKTRQKKNNAKNATKKMSKLHNYWTGWDTFDMAQKFANFWARLRFGILYIACQMLGAGQKSTWNCETINQHQPTSTNINQHQPTSTKSNPLSLSLRLALRATWTSPKASRTKPMADAGRCCSLCGTLHICGLLDSALGAICLAIHGPWEETYHSNLFMKVSTMLLLSCQKQCSFFRIHAFYNAKVTNT
jgi:hypothetical protein